MRTPPSSPGSRRPAAVPALRPSPRLVAAALGDWPAGRGPLYAKLAAAIAAAVDRGELASGARLPSERVLARTLAVSRTTVAAALDRLEEQGRVERRWGSGTWVVAPAPPAAGERRDHAAAIRARRLTGRRIAPESGILDLGVSVLHGLEGLPARLLAVRPDELERAGVGHGYHPLGTPVLRAGVARHLTATGLPTHLRQVVVTTGAQQAIALTARLLVRAGDTVLVESPTYPGAVDAYTRAGAELVAVATDAVGARRAELAAAVASTGARLAYLMPGCHNPLGAPMPEGRRRAVAAIVDESEIWLVEDHTLGHLVFDGTRARPVAATVRGDRVLTIGSLAKLAWGGFRVGWIRAAEPVVARLGRIKAAQDLGSPVLDQVIAARVLDSAEDLADDRRRRFRDRAALAGDLLEQRLPGWTHRRPLGGLSLWARLPEGDGDAFAAACLNHGVAVLPGPAASPDGRHDDHVRLSFAHPPDVLDEAFRRLASAWSSYRGRPAREAG